MSHGRRGKRRHLTPSDCLSLSNSREGASSLTQPLACGRGERDPNGGLYPRHGKRPSRRRLALRRVFPTRKPGAGRGTLLPVDGNSGPERQRTRDSHVIRRWASQEPRAPRPGVSVTWPALEDEAAAIDPLPDSYFGLLGCARSQPPASGHVGQLPDELLRMIFCLLPAADLYLSLSPVCRQWRRVIRDPAFVPYKKMYYGYRKGEETVVECAGQILNANSITAEDNLCLLNLVKFMASFKHARCVDPEAVLCCLKDHPLFKRSEACVVQRLPDLVQRSGAAKVWAVMCVIVLLSISVKDVQRLVTGLRESRSTLPASELSETLSCLATLLFASRERGINLSNRIHYNLFHVLYLMENPMYLSKRPFTNPYQAPRLVADVEVLTSEQQCILSHEIAPTHVVKIAAFAGTGKTCTLIWYAQQRPHLRFLYVASSESDAVQARSLYTPNVQCVTMDAMAYHYEGYKYQRRKKLIFGDLKPLAVLGMLRERGVGYIRAKLLCRTLSSFFCSADEEISVAHVPEICNNTRGDVQLMEYKEKSKLAEDAGRIWRKMVNLRETKTSGYFMTRDGCLKLWQLSKPSLWTFDAIFVDKAEDCSPAILDIVLSQKCGKFLVGDRHQQIHSFSGAGNALCEAPHTHTYCLTQSLRFGPDIAYLAATILEVCKHVRDKTLVGGSLDDGSRGNGVEQMAILCRGVPAAFDEALRLTAGQNPSKIHLIGGLGKFGLDTILDVWMLLKPDEDPKRKEAVIRDPFIRIFSRNGGFRGLKDYVSTAEDEVLGGSIAVVEKYRFRIPGFVQRITEYSVDIPALANVVLGTVHKAKGYEFDTVQMMDDFAKVPGLQLNGHLLSGFSPDVVAVEEWNLLYIAVTRARKHLVMSKSLENLLSFAGEYFLRTEFTRDLLRGGSLPNCHVKGCPNRIVNEAVLTMIKGPSMYGVEGDRRHEAGGPLCGKCLEQRAGPLTYLVAFRELVEQ
ncbi:F-box DNA helicase 1 [Callorhinchus milii]|uniref:F-box DNA helicase 1 n=1 Tax=Callorhinchus milii TaxID=7868 RepID=UPI001C3F98D5|nr:F-box DNA helicase 1 [Callorhinchus milii]